MERSEKRSTGRVGVAARLVAVTVGLMAGLVAGPSVAAAETAAKSAAAKPTATKKRPAPLNFIRAGQGPAVLFLHGLGGDSSVWIEEMQRLQDSHTVILVDLPGHGLSPPAVPPIDFRVIAQQVADVIASQKVGPVTLVGHSMGGVIAGYVALAAPRLVRGVVVVDHMFAPLPLAGFERDKLRFQLSRDPAAAIRRFMTPITHDRPQLDKVVAGARRVSGETFVGYLDFASDHDDLRTHVREIGAPVHVMVTPLLTEGQSDPAHIQLALSHMGFEGLINLSFDYFPNARHWIFWDDALGFHNSLARFLLRVEGPPPSLVVPPPPLQPGLRKKARSVAKAPTPL